METLKINLNNNVYRIFFVEINGSTIGIAEEKLEKYISQCIENGHYEEVCDVDSKYLYYVPQEIADSENENEIIESIKDVLN